jgi:hypothetical protein
MSPTVAGPTAYATYTLHMLHMQCSQTRPKCRLSSLPPAATRHDDGWASGWRCQAGQQGRFLQGQQGPAGSQRSCKRCKATSSPAKFVGSLSASLLLLFPRVRTGDGSHFSAGLHVDPGAPKVLAERLQLLRVLRCVHCGDPLGQLRRDGILELQLKSHSGKRYPVGKDAFFTHAATSVTTHSKKKFLKLYICCCGRPPALPCQPRPAAWES